MWAVAPSPWVYELPWDVDPAMIPTAVPGGFVMIGQSGKLLAAVLADNQLDVRVSNIVRCRPPENRDPTAAEMEACSVWLTAEVAAMPNERPDFV